jgi:hypothetical protein
MFSVILVFCVIICVSGENTLPTSQLLLSELLDKSQKLLDASNWVAALDILDEILMTFPNHQQSWHNRG